MIYVHVPFCKSFCVYCDFYSELACSDPSSRELYTEGLLKEVAERKEEILSTSEVNTLYIGGGTPSVMPLSFFESVLKELPLGGFDEFTVEVNPEDIVRNGEQYASGLRNLGVNRISMGVQSLDDTLLKWMGRRHDSARARQAFGILRQAGFSNISLDVIFGIGGLDSDTLLKTLDGIIELRPEHISAYQLSIEEGSALARLEKDGKYVQADEDTCSEQYYLICSRLREAGYEHYEISNWALPGYRARHNSAYWDRSPYVGLGPGAHSFLRQGGSQRRSWNNQRPHGWSSGSETLTPEEIREETIMLGLRRKEGVEVDGKRLSIPENKWFIADGIIADLICENPLPTPPSHSYDSQKAEEDAGHY